MSSLRSIYHLPPSPPAPCKECGRDTSAYGTGLHIYEDLLDDEPRPVYVQTIGPEGDVTIRLRHNDWVALAWSVTRASGIGIK